MQKDSHLFDDIAKLAGSAMGTVSQMGKEVESLVMAQVEKILCRMNLVTREEFETVREMAAKARAEQETLAAKLAELEKKLAGK